MPDFTNRSLWMTRKSGLQAPKQISPSLNGLVLYAPLWHPELNGSPFLSKDLNAHTLTVTGATWTSQGRQFVAGTNQKVVVPYNAAFALQNLTIQVVLKMDTVSGAVFQFFGRDTTLQWMMRQFNNTSVGIHMYLVEDDDTNHVVQTGYPLVVDQWYVLQETYDGTTQRIFLDNAVPTLTGATPSVAWSGNIKANTNDIYLGVRSDGYGDFDGQIAEVLIWNRALSSTERSREYVEAKRRMSWL